MAGSLGPKHCWSQIARVLNWRSKIASVKPEKQEVRVGCLKLLYKGNAGSG